MRLLIIIPHFHKSNQSGILLTNCLLSLQRVEPLLLQHTLVIDDASPDREIDELSKELVKRLGIKFAMKEENTCYSAVINAGAAYARDNGYDLILTLNNDVELKTPFYKKIRTNFRALPRLGSCGPTLLYPTGRVQSAGIQFQKPHQGIACEPQKMEYIYQSPEALKCKYVHGVTGAMQFIRMSAFEEVGGYSEEFPISYEDVEFCKRLWEKDWSIYYDPTIQAVHFESITRGYAVGPREMKSYDVCFDIWKRDEEILKDIDRKIGEANEQIKI